MKQCPKCEQQCSEHRDVCPLCAVPLVCEPARPDKAVFASTDLFGAEAEHERAENLGKTVRWLIGQIDRIHLALCPGQNGVWQERVRQAVEAAQKAPNSVLPKQ